MLGVRITTEFTRRTLVQAAEKRAHLAQHVRVSTTGPLVGTHEKQRADRAQLLPGDRVRGEHGLLESAQEGITMKTSLAAAVVFALILAAVPLSAHHSWPVSYAQLVTVKGTVTDFAWENPHPMMTLEVKTDDGKVEKWLVGGPAINRMEANGWTKGTVKPGDVITGTGYRFSDGQKIIRLERVVLPDGKEMRLYGR
jgi:hypothetical protein